MVLNAWDIAGVTKEYWLEHSLDIRIRLSAAPYIADWGYSLTAPRSLYDIPEGMHADKLEVSEAGLSESGNRVTNCSTMTMSIITSCFPDANWTLYSYEQLQLYAEHVQDSPDSPIAAVEEAGVAHGVVMFEENEWHLVQGIRELVVTDDKLTKFSGHAFLVLKKNGRLIVLEATSRGGVGPRYRPTTLAELEREYPHSLFIAVLSKT